MADMKPGRHFYNSQHAQLGDEFGAHDRLDLALHARGQRQRLLNVDALAVVRRQRQNALRIAVLAAWRFIVDIIICAIFSPFSQYSMSIRRRRE